MKEIEQKLNSMTGYTTAIVYDEPNNRYNYATAEVDSHIIDDILESDDVSMVRPEEESHVLGIMLENWTAEMRPAEGIQDDMFAENVKGVFFSEDSRMVIAKRGDMTTYVMCYE